MTHIFACLTRSRWRFWMVRIEKLHKQISIFQNPRKKIEKNATILSWNRRWLITKTITKTPKQLQPEFRKDNLVNQGFLILFCICLGWQRFPVFLHTCSYQGTTEQAYYFWQGTTRYLFVFKFLFWKKNIKMLFLGSWRHNIQYDKIR